MPLAPGCTPVDDSAPGKRASPLAVEPTPAWDEVRAAASTAGSLSQCATAAVRQRCAAGADRSRPTGSNPGSKLSATEPNSDQLGPALDGCICSHTARTFRLGAGRSQVQILSPRSNLPANYIVLFNGAKGQRGPTVDHIRTSRRDSPLSRSVGDRAAQGRRVVIASPWFTWPVAASTLARPVSSMPAFACRRMRQRAFGSGGCRLASKRHLACVAWLRPRRARRAGSAPRSAPR